MTAVRFESIQKEEKDMKKELGGLTVIVLAVVLLALTGCTGGGKDGPPRKAVAVLHSADGGKVHGIVSFMKDRGGVRMIASIEGLSPGLHGFHIHEYGDCSSPDFNSAGGHFNPMNMPHGSPDVDKRHAGDLGNIEADKTGLARYERVDKLLTLEGPQSIIGRAVVVHADPDDFTTQPTGAAGARLACGVIGIAN